LKPPVRSGLKRASSVADARDGELARQPAEEPRAQSQTRVAGSGWAETKAAAELAFDAFVESYMLKYEKAVARSRGTRQRK
jgi:hypothetical protein